jgi:hypothetical protein
MNNHKYPKFPKFGPSFTVRELIEQLERLPEDLPINQGFEEGVVPVVFHVANDDTHVLQFEGNDGTWTDDDA